MKKTAPLITLLVCSSAVSYQIGKMGGSDDLTAEKQLNRPSSAVRVSDRSSLFSEASNSRRIGDPKGRLAQFSSSVSSEQIQEIVQMNDPIERTEALLSFLNQLSPAEFEEVVASFRDLGITRERMGEYAIMLTAWAKTDPLGALTYAEENTGTAFARQTILSTWAQSQPDAAIAWAQENFESKEGGNNDANPWMVGIIKGLAGSDLNQATTLLEELPYSRGRGDALSSVLSKLRTQGMDDAKAWALNLTDERLQSGAISRLAAEMADEDPAGTLAWVETVSPEALERSASNVVQRWAEDDPESAMAWVEQQPEAIKAQAAEGMISTLAEDNPQQAAEWLNPYIGNPEFDDAIEKLVWKTSESDPLLSSNWIMNLTNERNQTRTYHRALRQMVQADAEATLSFIQNNEVPEGIRERAERYLADQNK